MRKSFWILIAVFGLLTAACTIDIEPNSDGSLNVESVIDEEKLQRTIDANVTDPDNEDVNVEFHDGYIAVDLKGPDEETGIINEVSFKARAGVEDGQLTIDLYDGVWNGEDMPGWFEEFWNNALARELEKEAEANPDASLLSVDVSDESVTMVWRIETDASKG